MFWKRKEPAYVPPAVDPTPEWDYHDYFDVGTHRFYPAIGIMFLDGLVTLNEYRVVIDMFDRTDLIVYPAPLERHSDDDIRITKNWLVFKRQ